MRLHRRTADRPVQSIVVVEHAVDDEVQTGGSGQVADLFVERIALEPADLRCSPEAVPEMVLEDRVEIRDCREEYLSAAPKAVHGMREDGADADLEIRLAHAAVDADHRPRAQGADRHQVLGSAVVVDELVGIHQILAIDSAHLLAVQGDDACPAR